MPGCSYSCSLEMGILRTTTSDLARRLSKLRREWKACDYDVLSRNCNHFSFAACAALEVKSPPEWLNELAGKANAAAEAIDGVLQPLHDAASGVTAARMIGALSRGSVSSY